MPGTIGVHKSYFLRGDKSHLDTIETETNCKTKEKTIYYLTHGHPRIPFDAKLAESVGVQVTNVNGKWQIELEHDYWKISEYLQRTLSLSLGEAYFVMSKVLVWKQ